MENQRLLALNRQREIGLLNAEANLDSLALQQKSDSLTQLQLTQKLEQADKNAQIAKAEQRRKNTAAILISLLALAGLGILIYRYQTRLEQSRLRARSLESEMQALRAFINPHFLFNALNSLNAFILTKKSDSAHEYSTSSPG